MRHGEQRRYSHYGVAAMNPGPHFDDVPKDEIRWAEDGHHYGRLAEGPHKGSWVRLTAAPIKRMPASSEKEA